MPPLDSPPPTPAAHDAPWYVVVEREGLEGQPWAGGDVVIGPFSTEAEASEYANDSLDVLDLLTEEAKFQGYVAGDVFWTQEPTMPAHGPTTPTYDD